jgi:hypothetical protein
MSWTGSQLFRTGVSLLDKTGRRKVWVPSGKEPPFLQGLLGGSQPKGAHIHLSWKFLSSPVGVSVTPSKSHLSVSCNGVLDPASSDSQI